MIEINNIPKHWQLKKLGEVCDIRNGKNQKAVVNPNGKYPIYGSAGIMGYADEYLCGEGATIIGRKGTINRPIYVRTKFWNVDTAFGFSPFIELIESRFLFFFCQSFNFHKLDKSTTIPSLAKTDLQKIELPIPPLPEQLAIVSKIEELFSELDNGIAQLKTAQQQLKVYRQSLLKWAFEGKLTNKNVKDGELPEGWKMLKTGDVIGVINNGYTPKSNFLSEGSGEIPFIKVYNLTFNGTLNFKKNPTFIPNIVHKKDLKRSICYPGDVLINIVGPPLGKVSVVPNQYPEWNINQAIVMFRPNERVFPKYIAYFLLNPVTINWLEGTSKATAGQWNVKVSTCREIPMPYPPLEQQQLIIDELESKLTVCDKIEETISHNLQQAETLRQSILKQAFEGNLVKTKP